MKKNSTLSVSVFIGFLILAMNTAFANHHSEDEDSYQKPSHTSLQEVLDAQDEATQARYQYRHPLETIKFFGIEPGMSVADVLPGSGGWYSKILIPYLGHDGHLLGVDYDLKMWPLFSFADEKFLKSKETWTTSWLEGAQKWRGESGAEVSATTFGQFGEESNASLDAIVFIRAMHHLVRFEDKGGYLTSATADAFAALKPGGIVGVVQHEAYPDRADSWADGNKGYVKKALIIEAFEKAGFEFVAQSDINNNPKDQADEGDLVWRLPPTLGGSKDKPELKKQMLEIGESNRMTLKFIKSSN
jgi:predicted methyltransferase